MKIPEPASKNEYRAYAARLRRVLRAELAKPESRRDGELIDECEKSALYCEQRLMELGCPRGKNYCVFSLKPVKWIAAAAALLIIGSSVISYAYGRKALSDKVQWNVRRFSLEDSGIWGDRGEEILRDETETRIYASEEELRAAFGENLLLPGSLKGVYFVMAEAHGVSGNALIRCEYRVNKKPLILEIDSFDHGGSVSVGETHFYVPDDFTFSHKGEALVGRGPDRCFVYFRDRQGRQYILTGGQGEDIIIDIADKMIKAGRKMK